jgi:hypothetical protein
VQNPVNVTLVKLFLGFIFGFIFLLILGAFSIPLFLHSCLRFCLWYEDALPLKYATFLDYAAEMRILEKTGGQWRFRHQNLQEHFANLDN